MSYSLPSMQRRHYPLIVHLISVALIVGGVVIVSRHHIQADQSVSNTSSSQHITSSSHEGATQTVDTHLQTIISTWASQQSFSSSILVQELDGRLRTANIKPTNKIITASTFKIYVAYAMLHAIEQGKYTLKSTLSDGNSVQTDLNNMILNSDNDASRTLGFALDWQRINSLLKSQSLTGTDLNNYDSDSTMPDGDKYSTAQDFVTFLTKLHAGTLLNAAHTQLLLNLMEKQSYRERIPAGVPSSITVADKPGWLTSADGENENIQNDAAIVYGPKSTYILVITTTGSSTRPLTNLSQQIYNYLQR